MTMQSFIAPLEFAYWFLDRPVPVDRLVSCPNGKVLGTLRASAAEQPKSAARAARLLHLGRCVFMTLARKDRSLSNKMGHCIALGNKDLQTANWQCCHAKHFRAALHLCFCEHTTQLYFFSCFPSHVHIVSRQGKIQRRQRSGQRKRQTWQGLGPRSDQLQCHGKPCQTQLFLHSQSWLTRS